MSEKKIFATKNGFTITDIDTPHIGVNDILIRVISSFYSPGTEEASANKLKASTFSKASETELKTGLPRWTCPPFPGVTPPTILVP